MDGRVAIAASFGMRAGDLARAFRRRAPRGPLAAEGGGSAGLRPAEPRSDNPDAEPSGPADLKQPNAIAAVGTSRPTGFDLAPHLAKRSRSTLDRLRARSAG